MKNGTAGLSRHFQRFTSEQRANHASSRRLGYQQRQRIGEYFFTHKALPGVCFPTRTAALRAAEDAYALLSEAQRNHPDAADWHFGAAQIRHSEGGSYAVCPLGHVIDTRNDGDRLFGAAALSALYPPSRVVRCLGR